MRQSAHDSPLSSTSSTYFSTLLHLERESTRPLYRQISQGLREAIASGELAEGSRLPPERAMAKELGVNRTTIMNAYNELASEGLIERHVGRGTLVKRAYFNQEETSFYQDMPSWLLGLASPQYPQSETKQNTIGITGQYQLYANNVEMLVDGKEGKNGEMISFAQAAPALDLFPVEQIRTLINEGLMDARQSAFGYCPVEGLQSLRRGIAERMRKRGVSVDVSNILILSGSTQGIGLIGRFLLHPGDEVVVEVPTYLGAIQTFRELGAKIIGIPTDNEGMRVDLLETILTRRQPRLIYTLPTFQNPTGVVMPLERRRRLLLLSQRYQIPILEDDAYGEIYFEGEEPQPLKAFDTHGNVLYLSTYSKTLAPGLRIAWLAAPEPVIERLSLHKQVFDLNTNAFGQWIVSELLRRSLFDEHLLMIREVYKKKCASMLQAIEAYWPPGIRINQPLGGFHLWCLLPINLRARTVLREALHEHVAFVSGEPFHVDGGGQHAMRLSFSSQEESNIREGVQRLGTVMKRLLLARTSSDERNPQTLEHIVPLQ
jgi:2-aminoadipate transaminase